MRRWRGLVVGLAVLGAAMVPGQSCGPFFSEAVFTMKHTPEGAKRFLAGHLGVVEASYSQRYLIAAYLWLQGRGLKAEEQAQMLPVAAPVEPGDRGGDGSGTGSGAGQVAMRKVPGSQWESYGNCLSDAFRQAEQTHGERVARYGAGNAEVKDWEAGQAAVFANCADGSVLPAAAPAGASLWLRQDRAYQTAAAEFYAGDFGKARADFEAIGRDEASPWHVLARYVAVRAMVRQATLVADDKPMDMGLMVEAEAKLRAMLQEPGMASMRDALESYLGVVASRAHPTEWAGEMAERLTRPKLDARFGQDLTDLLYSFDRLGPAAKSAGNEMVDWVATMQRRDGDRALERWRQTHAEVWLVAAMTLAQPFAPKLGETPEQREAGRAEDRAVAGELAAAALGVKPGSAAWATVRYQRLLLLGAGGGSAAERRAELDGLLARMEKTETLSTVNLFLGLRAATAATLGDFLRDAARVPAGMSAEDGEQEGFTDETGGTQSVCGKDIPVERLGDDGRRLDVDGAIVLNERLPVERMAEAGVSRELPRQLRFETALAAWSRAVLLDRPKVAAGLTAELAGCQPGMRPWLERYDGATTAEERRVNGLLALMRFPSVRPYVNEGFGRGDFAAYDAYRDNWWCGDMGTNLLERNFTNTYRYEGEKAPVMTLASKAEFADPPFVTKADGEAAERELKELAGIGTATDYFARSALEWVKAHPKDARNADLLGFAKRVMRNGCRSPESSQWDKKLFLALQRGYPESSWAKRYTTWE